jgi:hypothetical protein
MRSHQPLERLLVDGRRRRYLLIALTGIAPVFMRKWDQRFESAFLQR